MEKLGRFASETKEDDGAEKTPEEQELAKVKENLDIFKLFKQYTDKIIAE